MKVIKADKNEFPPKEIKLRLKPLRVFKLESVRYQNQMRQDGTIGIEPYVQCVRRCIDLMYDMVWGQTLADEIDVDLDEFIDG